ncbi:MAG: hypothetical protein K2G13_02415 [Muribaculaceae bacterium]|nr:hypothetical protein [Muribaculaceae bacterium]
MAKSKKNKVMLIIDFSTRRAVSDCEALGKILFTEPDVAKKILASKDKSSFGYFGDHNQLSEKGLTDMAEEIKNEDHSITDVL